MTPEETAQLSADESSYIEGFRKPKTRRQRIAEWLADHKVWGVALAIAVGLVLALWWVPVLLTPDVGSPVERARLVVEERRTVITALAALGAGITVWLSWRRHGLEAARHELDRDANRTGRYAAAVEQLGSESAHIRLGGIYALERIAKDSRRDSSAIVDVLAAFVRDTCRKPSAVPKLGMVAAHASLEPRADDYPATRIDVQAALTVLARRPNRLKIVDLTGAYLARADLRHADLNAARLNGADLSSARLQGAELNAAKMNKAILVGAYLNRAELMKADLTAADLTDAFLLGADLRGASCLKANFTRARVRRADLSGTYMRHANLTGVDLDQAADTSDMTR